MKERTASFVEPSGKRVMQKDLFEKKVEEFTHVAEKIVNAQKESGEELKEMRVYECPECRGACKSIDGSVSPYESIGCSKKNIERFHRRVERATRICSRCRGRGFILLPK